MPCNVTYLLYLSQIVMKKILISTLVVMLVSYVILSLGACKHSPILDELKIDTTSMITCDTINMSYSSDIQVILSSHCYECHSGVSPISGIHLSDYDTLKSIALSGRLLGALKHLDGYTPMPYMRDMLDTCTINKIESWVNDGAPHN